jgi:D-3-phosphoglycerate dehydrogenase
VPLNAETKGLIGVAELALLSPGSGLINTSRGELVDEMALVQALERKRLAGAALDVICNEREPQQRRQSPLLAYARTHDNLLITPHLAGATHESMAKTELFMARKLMAFLDSLEKESRPL